MQNGVIGKIQSNHVTTPTVGIYTTTTRLKSGRSSDWDTMVSDCYTFLLFTIKTFTRTSHPYSYPIFLTQLFLFIWWISFLLTLLNSKLITVGWSCCTKSKEISHQNLLRTSRSKIKLLKVAHIYTMPSFEQTILVHSSLIWKMGNSKSSFNLFISLKN